MTAINLPQTYIVGNAGVDTLGFDPLGHTATRDYVITTTNGTGNLLSNQPYTISGQTLNPYTGYTGASYIDAEHMTTYIEDGHVHLKSGAEIYVRGGKLHREDGPALIDESQGIKRWFLKGKELYKNSFKTIEKVNTMQAWELFNPVEIAEMRQRAIEVKKSKDALSL